MLHLLLLAWLTAGALPMNDGVKSDLTGAPAANAARPADMILVNANIYTMDPALPRARTVATREDRIIYVGDEPGALALKGPATVMVDLRGRTVLPGLIDAHGHISSLGHLARQVDLVGTPSASAVAEKIKKTADALGPGRWIQGRGWDQNDWSEKVFPSWRDLDAVSPNNPVVLRRIDGHAVWVNSRAMREAGVTPTTPDPPGGQIVRDSAGEPTGVFVDAAADLIRRKVPPYTRDETRDALKLGMRRSIEAGLTGVHDAGVSGLELELYRELLVEGGYLFRVYAMLQDDEELLAAQIKRGPEVGLGNHRLTVRSLKMYMDGALGSRGAALSAPYQDDAGNSGLLLMEPERLSSVVRRAVRGGLQVNVHAIGDRANKLALDGIRAGILKTRGKPDHRSRIEHAQVLTPADIPRFAELQVIASMQPTHATSDMYWAEDRLGSHRVQGAYAWRSLLNAGARLACGSDFPVESENPLLGFYAAVTRQDPKGWPEGGWLPAQRLTREEALRCFTLDAAYAAFEEELRGSISSGKLADMTIVSKDIMQIPAPEILEARVPMTIIGGKIVHDSR